MINLWTTVFWQAENYQQHGEYCSKRMNGFRELSLRMYSTEIGGSASLWILVKMEVFAKFSQQYPLNRCQLHSPDPQTHAPTNMTVEHSGNEMHRSNRVRTKANAKWPFLPSPRQLDATRADNVTASRWRHTTKVTCEKRVSSSDTLRGEKTTRSARFIFALFIGAAAKHWGFVGNGALSSNKGRKNKRTNDFTKCKSTRGRIQLTGAVKLNQQLIKCRIVKNTCYYFKFSALL